MYIAHFIAVKTCLASQPMPKQGSDWSSKPCATFEEIVEATSLTKGVCQ